VAAISESLTQSLNSDNSAESKSTERSAAQSLEVFVLFELSSDCETKFAHLTVLPND
jgi:hypothetical protein